MSALENLLKLGKFPAVRRCYEEEYVTDNMWEDAIEELADKLVKSIEWGRIEQQRKRDAEERADRAEAKLAARELDREGYMRRILAAETQRERAEEELKRAEEEARTAKMIAEEERRRADRLAKERDWQYDENVERIRLETAAEDRAERLLWMLDRLAQQAADVGKAEGFYFPRTKEAVLSELIADDGRNR